MTRPHPRSHLFPYTTLFRSHTINSSLVNEARVGYVRTKYGFVPPFNSSDLCTQLGIVNCNTPLLGGIAIDKDRKSTRLNSSHRTISYAVFCLKKKNISS